MITAGLSFLDWYWFCVGIVVCALFYRSIYQLVTVFRGFLFRSKDDAPIPPAKVIK